MKRAVARLSQRGRKRKDENGSRYTWQGEQMSALDQEAFLASLEQANRQRSPPAKLRKNSPQLRGRRYKREMVVVGDDMLGGNAPELQDVSDASDGEISDIIAEAKTKGMRFRSPSFHEDVEDLKPSPIEEETSSHGDVTAPQTPSSEPGEDKTAPRPSESTPEELATANQHQPSDDQSVESAEVAQLKEKRLQLEDELAVVRDQVTELEEQNQALISEIGDLRSKQGDSAAISAMADRALAKCRDLEEEQRTVVPKLQAKLAAAERRSETAKRQNEQLALQLSHATSSCNALKQKLKVASESSPRPLSPANSSEGGDAARCDVLQEEIVQLQEKIKEMETQTAETIKAAEEKATTAKARADDETAEREQQEEECQRLRQQNQRLLTERHRLRQTNQKLEQQLESEEEQQGLGSLLVFMASHLPPAASSEDKPGSSEMEQKLHTARNQVLAAESYWQQAEVLSRAMSSVEARQAEWQEQLRAKVEALSEEKSKKRTTPRNLLTAETVTA